MTDDPDDTDETEEQEPEEPTEQPDEEEDERPDIEEEERAELPDDLDIADIADDIEEEAGGAADEATDEEADETDEEGDESDESDADGGRPTPDGETWGDAYVELLGVLLIEVADATSEDAPSMTPEDVASLATAPPVQLDQSVDRLAAEMGGTEDLPPGQAVAISTALLAVIVLGRESDIPQNAASKMKEKMNA